MIVWDSETTTMPARLSWGPCQCIKKSKNKKVDVDFPGKYIRLCFREKLKLSKYKVPISIIISRISVFLFKDRKGQLELVDQETSNPEIRISYAE